MKNSTKIIVLLLVLALIGGGVGYYLYTVAQEDTAPGKAIDTLLAQTDGRYWAEGVRAEAYFDITEYEDEATVIDTLLCAPLTQGEITYRSTEDPTVYYLTVDGTDFCKVTLTESEDTAMFGLHYWDIASTEISESWLVRRPRTVEVTGPIDMCIRINGVPVSTRNALKTDDPTIVTFRVEGIYADYELNVRDGEDNPMTCTSSDGDTYTYTK